MSAAGDRRYQPPRRGRGRSRRKQRPLLTEDAECGRMFLLSPSLAPVSLKRLIHWAGKQGGRTGSQLQGAVGGTGPALDGWGAVAGACPHAAEGVAGLAPAPAATPAVTRGEEEVFGGREQTRGSFLWSDKLPRGVKREPPGDISTQTTPPATPPSCPASPDPLPPTSLSSPRPSRRAVATPNITTPIATGLPAKSRKTKQSLFAQILCLLP